MGEIAELKKYNKKEVLNFCEKAETEEFDILKDLEKQKIDKEKIEEISKILEDSYAYELSTKIPTKSSVTKLKKGKDETIEVNFGVPKFMRKRGY